MFKIPARQANLYFSNVECFPDILSTTTKVALVGSVLAQSISFTETWTIVPISSSAIPSFFSHASSCIRLVCSVIQQPFYAIRVDLGDSISSFCGKLNDVSVCIASVLSKSGS